MVLTDVLDDERLYLHYKVEFLPIKDAVFTNEDPNPRFYSLIQAEVVHPIWGECRYAEHEEWLWI